MSKHFHNHSGLYHFIGESLIDDFMGNPAWADFAPGLYLGQSQVEHELGVYVNGEFVLHVPGTYQDGDGGSFNLLSWDNLTWSGLPEGVELGAEPTDAEAGTQSCLTYSGTPFQEGVFEVTVTGDLMVSVFGNPVSAGLVSSSFTMVIIHVSAESPAISLRHAVLWIPTMVLVAMMPSGK